MDDARGVTELTLDVGRGRVRPSAIVPALRRIADRAVSIAEEGERRRGAEISCGAGCDMCCRLLVTVSAAEAHAIARHIAALAPARRDRIEQRFATALQASAAAGITIEELERIPDLDRAATKALAERYWRAQIPCPLLDEDRRCSIYEDRPLACRQHLVTSPRDACGEPSLERVRPAPLPWDTRRFAERLPSSVRSAIPLVLSRGFAERHPEARARHTGAELLAIATSEPRLIADWEMPAALMVPFAPRLFDGLLQKIAAAAAAHVGVILLSPDPAAARQFVDAQPEPAHFTIVTAGFDTPWIRDRAPIAIRLRDTVEWRLPRLPDLARAADDRLFPAIARKPAAMLPILLSGGNLVSDGNGLAISSEQVLAENGFRDPRELADAALALGIRRWLLFPPFAEELTAHADVHVRFLAEDLLAIAWSRSREDDAALAERIETEARAALPNLRCLRLPMRSDGPRYASPVNWIQLGTTLLVPRYPLTPPEDEDAIRSALEAEGYRVSFLDSPTVDVAGSLHCLTASIYVEVTPPSPSSTRATRRSTRTSG